MKKYLAIHCISALLLLSLAWYFGKNEQLLYAILSVIAFSLIAFYLASKGVKEKKTSHFPMENLVLFLFIITFAFTFRNGQESKIYNVLSYISLMAIGILSFDYRRKYQTFVE